MRLSDVIGAMDISAFPQIALVIFLITFGLVCARLFRSGNKEASRQASMLPLDDDTTKDAHR